MSNPELRDLLQAEALRQRADTLPAFTDLQRRATRRRQHQLGGSLIAVLAVAAAIAVPSLRSAGVSDQSPGDHPTPPVVSTSPTDATGAVVPDFLPPVGLSMVRRNGETLPTRLEAVAVADGAVADVRLRESAATDKAHTAAWIIEAQGDFGCIDCATAGQTGSVLTGIYDPVDVEWDAVSVGDTWADLNTLGAAFPLPTRDAATGKVVTVAQAKALALLESSKPSTATVVWTRELTAGQLAAESSDPVAHIGLRPDTPLIVVAVQGASPNGASTSGFGVVVTVDGTGPGTSSMDCGADFCGVAPPG